MIGKIGVGLWAAWGLATAAQIDWNGKDIVPPGKIIQLDTKSGHITRHVDSAEFFADFVIGNRYFTSTTAILQTPQGDHKVCKQDFWRVRNRSAVLPFMSYNLRDTSVYSDDIKPLNCTPISSDVAVKLKASFEEPKKVKIQQKEGSILRMVGSSHIKLSIVG